MKKAVVYLRKNVNGHYHAIANQLENCQIFADSQNIDIAGIFGEYRTLNLERDIGEIVLAHALSFCHENDIDLILIDSLKCISRDLRILSEFIKVAESLGVKIHSVDHKSELSE